jgi:hypothetical protein
MGIEWSAWRPPRRGFGEVFGRWKIPDGLHEPGGALETSGKYIGDRLSEA